MEQHIKPGTVSFAPSPREDLEKEGLRYYVHDNYKERKWTR